MPCNSSLYLECNFVKNQIIFAALTILVRTVYSKFHCFTLHRHTHTKYTISWNRQSEDKELCANAFNFHDAPKRSDGDNLCVHHSPAVRYTNKLDVLCVAHNYLVSKSQTLGQFPANDRKESYRDDDDDVRREHNAMACEFMNEEFYYAFNMVFLSYFFFSLSPPLPFLLLMFHNRHLQRAAGISESARKKM